MTVLIVGALLAQAGPPGGDVWLQYGAVGAIAALGVAFVWSTIKRLIRERDEERAYSREIERSLRTDIVPLLTTVQTTTTEAMRVITEARAEWQQMRRDR